MTAFSPTRNFNRLSPFERMSRAYETPMGFGQVMGDQLKQGILDSYGLGTAIRELSLPPLLNDAPQRGDTPENFATRQRVFEEKALDEEAYKASPYFRKEVPWERGMTEDRAAALAGMWDQKMIRGHFAEKQPIAAFMGQLFGQAFDPINYIPVFGPGMRTAAVAKAGSIGGRMAIAASEAAINTAAFSVLTSGIRDRFGDDTSFNSIMLEIATSALIGGAFGAGAGVLMRGQDARVRREVRKAVESLQTIATKQEAVALLNDATHGLATKGMPDISATAGQIVSNTAEKLEARSAGARALVNETALIAAPDEPGRVVISPQGSRVEVQPEVVDISALTHASGSLQVRDRTRFDSQKWVEETATTLNPALLMPDISSDRGAPLVGDDNIIDSGNGRVMALRRVYDAYPEKAAEYRAALEKAGYDLTGIERPVLISRRTTPLSPEARAQFNAESNARTSAAMSATEIAQMDADAMSDDVLAKATDAPITAASNRPFVRAFLANIPATEHGALIDAQGNLSAAGAARLQNAVVAAAYADADPAIMRRFTEATDDNSRTILAAMSDVAGVWARMRREITRGNIDPAFDPTPSITEAVRLLNGWRAQAQRESRPIGTVIKEGMAQIDLLAGGLRPDVSAMLRALYTDDSFSRAVGRERLTNLLSTMVTKVTDIGAPSLLERPNVPLERIIASAQADGSPDLFAPASALGFPEGGGGEGRGAEVPPSGEGRGQGAEGSGPETPPLEELDEMALDAREEATSQLLQWAEAGDIEAIKGSPELAAVTDQMYAMPETHRVEGYGTMEWAKKRVYAAPDGKPLNSVIEAAEYLIEGARNLAAKELGLEPWDVAKERKAVIVIGPPAAGKSTIANQIARRLKAAIPDPDEAKKIMPEYADGLGANATHEESGMLADLVLRMLTLEGDNVVIPKVGGKVKSIEGLTTKLKDIGYTVDVVLMDVPPREAFRRMIGRYVQTGRLIPPRYFDEVASAPRETYAQLKEKGSQDGIGSVTSDRGVPAVLSEGDLKVAGYKPGEIVFDPGPRPTGTGRGDGGPAQPRVVQPPKVESLIDRIAAARDLKLVQPKDDPVPEGLVEAEARVGKPETLDETAEHYGVDSETGEFDELGDIDQIEVEGRLTPEDKTALKAAEEDFKLADAYGKALDAAVRCVI